MQAAQRERRRLAEDLHDGAQQRLMGIQIKLRMAERLPPDGDLAELLDEIDAYGASAVDELPMLARGIYRPVLRDFGTADALRAVAAGWPVAPVGGCFRINGTQRKRSSVHVTIPNAPRRAVRTSHPQPALSQDHGV